MTVLDALTAVEVEDDGSSTRNAEACQDCGLPQEQQRMKRSGRGRPHFVRCEVCRLKRAQERAGIRRISGRTDREELRRLKAVNGGDEVKAIEDMREQKAWDSNKPRKEGACINCGKNFGAYRKSHKRCIKCQVTRRKALKR